MSLLLLPDRHAAKISNARRECSCPSHRAMFATRSEVFWLRAVLSCLESPVMQRVLTHRIMRKPNPNGLVEVPSITVVPNSIEFQSRNAMAQKMAHKVPIFAVTSVTYMARPERFELPTT